VVVSMDLDLGLPLNCKLSNLWGSLESTTFLFFCVFCLQLRCIQASKVINVRAKMMFINTTFHNRDVVTQHDEMSSSLQSCKST
jgi:hypothetical protein